MILKMALREVSLTARRGRSAALNQIPDPFMFYENKSGFKKTKEPELDKFKERKWETELEKPKMT